MLKPVGILAIAPIGRPPRGLDIGGAPRLRAQRAERRRRVKRAGPDLEVVGLQDGAALRRPIGLQLENEGLEARPGRGAGVHFSVAFSGISMMRRTIMAPPPIANSILLPWA